jgi:hypothetical protein
MKRLRLKRLIKTIEKESVADDGDDLFLVGGGQPTGTMDATLFAPETIDSNSRSNRNDSTCSLDLVGDGTTDEVNDDLVVGDTTRR